MTKSESIIYSTIELSHLMDFKNHVFIKYEEKELQSMMLSIKEIGVINPIVVRPHNQFEGMYEIISGHNRVEACKRIGEKEIHAIIYKNIPNDIIAELMLIESNLKQRSINNSKITEKARVISRRYELIKKLSENKEGLSESECLEFENLKRSKPFGISERQMKNYLQIHNNLIQGLKELCDNDKLGMKAAVEISYIEENAQIIVQSFILEENVLSQSKANIIRKKAETTEINKQVLIEIFSKKEIKKKTEKTYKVPEEIMEKYFQDVEEEDIPLILEMALEKHFFENK